MNKSLEYVARANARSLNEVLAELVAVPGQRVGYELADALNELLPKLLAAGETSFSKTSFSMRADMIETVTSWLSRVDPTLDDESTTS